MTSAATALAELTEKEWQTQVIELASLVGFNRIYHTFNSRRSQSGFPDLCMVRDRVIYAELKREHGKPRPAQKEWLDGLARAGAEAYLWRPSDLDEIGQILGKRWTFEHDFGAHWLRSELTTLQPRSLWIAGVGRAEDPVFKCVVDESAGLADA